MSSADGARVASPSSSEPAAAHDYRELLGFALRSPRRHPKLATLIFVAAFGATVVAAMVLPRTYQADVKILAQRNLVMAALGNPRRSIPSDADAPTRGVSEAILDQENLVALVKDGDLLDRWKATRPALLRAKDWLTSHAFGPMSEADRQRAMVEIVAHRLSATTDDGTIHIAVQWDDPQVAFDLVSLTESRFLNGRSALETSAIVETISILEAEATTSRTAVATDLAETMRLAAETTPPTPTRGRAGAKALPARPRLAQVDIAMPNTDLARTIASKLDEKRRAIRSLEEPWERTLADLRAKLAELKLTYASAHPLVIEQERRIDDANVVPAALVALRLEEKALLAQADALPVSATRGARAVTSSFSSPDPVASAPMDLAAVRDDPPELAAARARLETSTRRYEDLVDRIDAARIELETTRAAFKYRYRVTQPAELPKKPLKPNVPVLLAGGSIFAVLLAFFASIARDLAGGRLLESWQAPRRLGVPLLAEIDEP